MTDADLDNWPTPPFDPDVEPHFLIILTPPCSGSTALAAVINSSPKSTFLQEHGEGQWLIPGLCAKDRWDPEKMVNYDSVRAVWLSAFQFAKRSDSCIEVVIEKSPPNMVRIAQMLRVFKRVSLLANIRDPYAYCASRLYRNFDVHRLCGDQRLTMVEGLALDWIKKGRMIRTLIGEYAIALVTYEEICRYPQIIKERLRLPRDFIDSINFDVMVKVKDYPIQGIVSQNSRQLARLSGPELQSIKSVLDAERELVEFFGYG